MDCSSSKERCGKQVNVFGNEVVAEGLCFAAPLHFKRRSDEPRCLTVTLTHRYSTSQRLAINHKPRPISNLIVKLHRGLIRFMRLPIDAL